MFALLPKDLDIIRRAPLLMGMPGNVLNRLLDVSRVIKFPRRKLLFQRRDQATSIYLIFNGWVKVYLDKPDGKQAIIGIFMPGDTVAEAAIFLGRDYPANAEVAKNARLLEIPSDVLLKLLRENSDILITMLGTLSQKQRELILRFEQTQNRSTTQRLAYFLLSLCADNEGPTTLILPCQKKVIAARLCMKPESLSRALIKLKNYGVSSSGLDVEIGDIAVLRKYCENY